MASIRKRHGFVGAADTTLPSPTEGRSYLQDYRAETRTRRRVESFIYSRVLAGAEVTVPEVARLLRNSRHRDAMGRRGDATPEELKEAMFILGEIARTNRSLARHIVLEEVDR